MRKRCFGGAWVVLLLGAAWAHADDGADLTAWVQADWNAQEVRAGRTADAPEAIAAALERAERLLNHLAGQADSDELRALKDRFEVLREQAKEVDALDAGDRIDLYRAIRSVTREAALGQPLVAGRPLVFLRQHRFVNQMMHEYLGYFYDYGDISGGGVAVLPQPGRSLATVDLTADRFPKGNFTTLSLAHDARTLYFAFADRAETKPAFGSPEQRWFHIYAMDADGGNLRQLTSGDYDDIDPCPLPDGGLAFLSTRRGGFVRCNNPWEPIGTYTLHRMDADGSNIRQLSAHETNEWHPSVLNDGRLVYIRWDYVDRSAANFHGLWATAPDGTNPVALFGNYTMEINACYQPHAIPGSRRIAFVTGAHHAVVGGGIALVDPDQARLDRTSGEDRLDSVEVLTPEIAFPESHGWPGSYFHSPWPLSEDVFLVSFSHEPLGGMGPGTEHDGQTGLYYFDRFGNLELLYREEANSCMYPIPLAPRPVPPVMPTQCEPEMGAEGEFILADVRQSLMPLPADREVVALRVFQILPKSESHVFNQPLIGYARGESARMLLGTVPVESDGSAYFRAPAGKPLYFQAVDARGHAVQGMRSVAYLQPGERRGCVGCHEPRATAPPRRELAAMRRPPSTIEPGPEGTAPMGFARLVQPVLDRHCVACHNGSPQGGHAVLTGEAEGNFTRAYNALEEFVRWHEWGDRSISQIATRPGTQGADASPLTAILGDATHRDLNLPDADRRRIALWLDANAPFFGSYDAPRRTAQLQGDAVAPPELQ